MASGLVLVNEKVLWSVPKKSASAPHRTGNEVRDRGAITNKQIIPIQDIELNRAVDKFSLAATISTSVLFTGLLGINLIGLPGAGATRPLGVFRLLWVVFGLVHPHLEKEQIAIARMVL